MQPIEELDEETRQQMYADEALAFRSAQEHEMHERVKAANGGVCLTDGCNCDEVGTEEF